MREGSEDRALRASVSSTEVSASTCGATQRGPAFDVAPNNLLGGEKPRDLIRTEREQEVRYLLRGIQDGITT